MRQRSATKNMKCKFEVAIKEATRSRTKVDNRATVGKQYEKQNMMMMTMMMRKRGRE